MLVLALPRGGVPVAVPIARNLRAPLDVFVVRKLGLPGHAELAMGAIASGGVRVLNESVIRGLCVPLAIIEHVTAEEERELKRRELLYRAGRPPADLRDRIVILVDDGIATGSTMMAAIRALRQLSALRIVVAAPTVAPSTFAELADMADEVVAVITPENFFGVGQWYDDFRQVSDEEVWTLVSRPNDI